MPFQRIALPGAEHGERDAGDGQMAGQMQPGTGEPDAAGGAPQLAGRGRAAGQTHR